MTYLLKTTCLARKVLAGMAAQLPEAATDDVYFLVDFFHVAEYLSKAANAIAATSPRKRTSWPRGARH